jgi:hypothetical protein
MTHVVNRSTYRSSDRWPVSGLVRRGMASASRRVQRLGWLGVWFIARHGLRLWLAPPQSTRAER